MTRKGLCRTHNHLPLPTFFCLSPMHNNIYSNSRSCKFNLSLVLVLLMCRSTFSLHYSQRRKTATKAHLSISFSWTVQSKLSDVLADAVPTSSSRHLLIPLLPPSCSRRLKVSLLFLLLFHSALLSHVEEDGSPDSPYSPSRRFSLFPRSIVSSLIRNFTLGPKRPFTLRLSIHTRPVQLRSPPMICLYSSSPTMPARATRIPSIKSY